MMKRERADRHGIYAHPDGRMLARHRTRLGAHDMLLRSFHSLREERRNRAYIPSTLLEEAWAVVVSF